jgi:hypothetical protein
MTVDCVRQEDFVGGKLLEYCELALGRWAFGNVTDCSLLSISRPDHQIYGL